MPVRAADIAFTSNKKAQTVKERIFRERGEGRYSLDLLPAGITIEVDRLKRHSEGLVGELTVTVNGNFPEAKTVEGVLSIGDFNFSSVQTRNTRAKLIAERSRAETLDWYGFLEEFAIRVLASERKGRPAQVLADIEVTPDDKTTWEIGDFPLLRTLPTVVFGDSASGKSYLAMWLAGSLANQEAPILYADWEFDASEHKKRLQRLFQPMPKTVHYARCDRPLREEAERLSRLIRELGCKYVICDSIGFAVEGPAEAQEGAAAYFRYLRQLGVGSLSIAHIPKQYEDGKEAQIFGSVFFRHGARSVWFIQRTQNNPPDEVSFGLYHRKSNTGSLLAPRGYRLKFLRERTTIEPIKVGDVDELESGLPLLDRMKRKLTQPMTVKSLAEELNTTAAAIRAMASRHSSTFIRVGNKLALVAQGVDF